MKFTKHSVLILCLAVFTGCKTEDILDTSETETICLEILSLSNSMRMTVK
jgi:hypothetical protein